MLIFFVEKDCLHFNVVQYCLIILPTEYEGVVLSVCSVESPRRLRGFRLMRAIERNARKENVLAGEKRG
jgi:hypothetical protein